MANLTTQLASYAYAQYSDDSDIVAFFTAYNQLSQANLDAMNALVLPNYQSKSGNLLNWVGENIYGEERKSIAVGIAHSVGDINTYEYNQLESNKYSLVFKNTDYAVSDTVYQSIITWNYYKADGFQFTLRWLKRRVYRFLNGGNNIQSTYNVSVFFTSATAVTIQVPASNIYSGVLSAAIQSGILMLPIGFTFTVTTV